MHLRQRIMIGILAGGALAAELSLSPVAVAAGAPAVSGAGTNNDTVSTNVSISTRGMVAGVPSPYQNPPGVGPTTPACWLAPFAGDGAPTPTYTPAAFGAYMDNQIALGTGGSSLPAQSSQAYAWKTIYHDGNSATNGAVRLQTPPYNKGMSGGSWDFEVCSQSVKWQTILGVEQNVGANDPNEQWFWINNNNAAAPPYVLSPSVLAEYAVANLTPAPKWPKSAPDFLTEPSTVNALTTVKLPADAGVVASLGYVTDSATASLTLEPNISSTVTAVPVSITISSPDIASTVSCNFALLNGIYSLGDSCQIKFTVPSPPGGTDPVTASETWMANWAGAPNGSNWPRKLPPINLPQMNVDVQEIQAIVGPQTPAP